MDGDLLNYTFSTATVLEVQWVLDSMKDYQISHFVNN
jgi:hypothetical protein